MIDATSDTMVSPSGGASFDVSPTVVVLVASGTLIVGGGLWWIARHGSEIGRHDDPPGGSGQ